MHEVLVNCLVKLAQDKGVVYLDMTIAVDWDVKPQTKQTKSTFVYSYCPDEAFCIKFSML